MVTLYLINSVTAGGRQRYAGEGIDLVCDDRAALDDAGAILWPASDPTVAAGAVIAQKLKLKGASSAMLDGIMHAAVVTSLSTDLTSVTSDLSPLLSGQFASAPVTWPAGQAAGA